MKEMTNKQRDVYEFICQRIRSQGFPPTVREIGKNFQISVKGAYDHLKAIEKKGYIRCTSSKSRAIEVLERMPMPSEMKVEDLGLSSRPGMVRIPLMGFVAAGMPILAEQNIEEEFYFPKALFGEQELFALRVRGDSMINAGIHDGDLALVRMQNQAGNGEIVVAMLENEATIKRFFRERNRIRLEPENPEYEPIYSSEVQVVGRVVWVFRKIG